MTREAEPLLARSGIPDLELSDVLEPGGPANRRDPSAIRAEGHARRRAAMTPARQELAAGRGIQETHRRLIAGGGQDLAIRAEVEAIRTPAAVSAHRGQFLPCPRVPNFDEIIDTIIERGQLLVVRAEDHAARLRR